MALLRLILIFIIVYLILKILFRYVFPYFLASYVNKKMDQMNGAGKKYRDTENRKEGDVTINTNNTNKGKNKNNSGEYVDFEEIND